MINIKNSLVVEYNLQEDVADGKVTFSCKGCNGSNTVEIDVSAAKDTDQHTTCKHCTMEYFVRAVETDGIEIVSLNPVEDIDEVIYSKNCPECGESVYISFDNGIPFACDEDVTCRRCKYEFIFRVISTEHI